MKKFKSLISLLLSIVMVLGMLPVHAHEAEDGSEIILKMYGEYGYGWSDASLTVSDGENSHDFTLKSYFEGDYVPFSVLSAQGLEFETVNESSTDGEYHIPYDPVKSYTFSWGKGFDDQYCSFEIYLDDELYSTEYVTLY